MCHHTVFSVYYQIPCVSECPVPEIGKANYLRNHRASLVAQMVKNLPAKKKESACNKGDWVQSLGQEDPLEKGTAIHSSILAWRIPRTEEPGRLQSMESERVAMTERPELLDLKERVFY